MSFTCLRETAAALPHGRASDTFLALGRLLHAAYCLLPTAFRFMLSSDAGAGVAEWQTLRT
jgi:hypothetical protein